MWPNFPKMLDKEVFRNKGINIIEKWCCTLLMLHGRHTNRVTDSCRDGWSVPNYSSSFVQVFQDRRSVQFGDGWNARNWLNTNILKLVEIWIWIFQNLRCLSCKSTNFVLVVKSTLMPFFWLFGLCLFVWLFGMYDS